MLSNRTDLVLSRFDGLTQLASLCGKACQVLLKVELVSWLLSIQNVVCPVRCSYAPNDPKLDLVLPSYLRLRSRTPGPPPFSSMNSMPSASSVSLIK